MGSRHRKRVQHFDIPGHVHELTFSCHARSPLLEHDGRRQLFLDCLDKAFDRQQFGLLAYVIMPEHVHLLVVPRAKSARISSLLADIKRPFSWKLRRSLEQERSSLLKELTIRTRPGVTGFRFWQEGGGYDRNVTDSKAVLTSMDYLHHNPVRRGLCKRAVDWPWSSAPRLMTDDIGSLCDPPKLFRFDPASGHSVE